MQEFLGWLLRAQGVTPDPGTELRFELASFPDGGRALLVWLAACVLVAAVVVIHRREGKGRSDLTPRRRRALTVLRATTLLFVGMLWFEPRVVAVRRDVRPGHVLLLVDASQSMTHRDAFRGADVAPLAAAWREIGVAEPAGATRETLLRALLQARDGALLAGLGAANELRIVAFAGAATPIADVAALPQASGGHTNLGGAIRTALERSRDAQIAAVVVLSDGRRNLGPKAAEIARLLTQRRVGRTFVLPIGDPTATQAVAVRRIEAPEKVFRQDPFRITVTVTSEGHPRGERTVRLARVMPGATPDAPRVATVITERTVTLGDADAEATLVFDDLRVDDVGRATFRAEIVPPTGEPAVPERHTRDATVTVLGEQTRVLLVAGSPTREYRVLRSLLMRDRTIRVSCWLQSADPEFPQDGDEPLTELPVEADALGAFDVVLLVDPDPAKLPPAFGKTLAEHVLGAGAGLWFVAGEKYTLDALRPDASTKPLIELLPVEADVVGADRSVVGFGRAFAREWPFELTPVGAAHEVTRVLPELDRNAELFAGLPGMHFAFPVLRAKPAASTLLAHGDPAFDRAGEPMPVFVVHQVGAGRTAFLGTDDTHRWRALSETTFDRFWVKGIRHLFEGRLSSGNPRLRIDLGSRAIAPGESLTLTVDAKDEAMQPLRADAFELSLRRDEDAPIVVALAPSPTTPGRFATTWTPPAAGHWRVTSVASFGRVVEDAFVVAQAETEAEGPVDMVELTALAAVEGGVLLRTPTELIAAAAAVPSASTTDVVRLPTRVGDGPWTLAFLIALLTAEWWLRKRANLL